jgi:hypothetical protein
MRSIVFLLIMLNATVSWAQQNGLELLERPDLGLRIAIPRNPDKETMRQLARFITTQPIAKNLFSQTMQDITPDRPVIQVSGNMRLAALSSDLDYPVIDQWIDCNDVQSRKDQAQTILTEIEDLQDRLLVITEGINNDTTPINQDLLAEISAISDEIVIYFDQLGTIYPPSLNDKVYELEYEWPQVMTQICRNQTPLTPDFTLQTLSMPGTFWQSSQGGQISEFPSISREPYFGTSQLTLHKTVSAQQLCLDTQKIQMLVGVNPHRRNGCSYLNPATEIFLEAGDFAVVGEPTREPARMEPVSCRKLVADYRDWLSEASPGTFATINFEMMTNKIRPERMADGLPKTHGGYMQASLGLDGQDLTGRGAKLFSERRENRQGFHLNRADQVELRLEPSGRAQIKLITWGNTVLPIRQTSCYRDHFGDFLTGYIYEGNGTSAITVTLQKSKQIRLILYNRPELHSSTRRIKTFPVRQPRN